MTTLTGFRPRSAFFCFHLEEMVNQLTIVVSLPKSPTRRDPLLAFRADGLLRIEHFPHVPVQLVNYSSAIKTPSER